MASSEDDDLMDTIDDAGDDLFGDDDGEDTIPAEKVRELGDRELDSGDDEGRNDRAPEAGDEDDMDAGSERNYRVLQQEILRHNLPNPADGEINILRLPKFLGIDPSQYNAKNFKPPTHDHHEETKSANFSASAVSASTVRFRVNESTGQLESNAVIYKWSNGTTTIGVGDQQFELQTQALAPSKEIRPYEDHKDSHSYLATPSLSSSLILLVGHMTNQYTVRPNRNVEDDALEKLQRSLAAATKSGKDDNDGIELMINNQDPELQKKRAEIAEKERMRAQRRRETAQERTNKSRAPLGGRGGLNVDDLEGRSGRRAAPGPGRKAPKPKKRRADYDSDDDLPRGTRNREDDYDHDDGFLATSDEEEEEGVDDDEDEEEILDDDSDRERPKAKKQKISKPEVVSDADADAEADLDDEDAPVAPVTVEPGNRGRKRNIIEDDDDE